MTAASATSSNRTVNVACAGLGRIGARHAHNLAYRTPHAKLVGVFDQDPSKEQWTKQTLPDHVRFAGSFDDLIAQPDIDLVWIATPTPFHADQIIACLDRDLHVFCEKPISLDLETAKKVNKAAKAKPHLYVSIGFLRRFDEAYELMSQRIQDGAIGKPLVMRTVACDPKDETGHFVNVYAPVSGGIFVDCAIHDIDTALWMLGEDNEVASAYATGSSHVLPKLMEYGDHDTVLGIVTFKSGAIAEFYCSRISQSGQQSLLEVIGVNGKLSLQPSGASSKLKLSDGVSSVRDGGVNPPDYYDLNADAMRREPEIVVSDIYHGRGPRLTLDSSVKGLEIGLALTESLRSGKAISY